jgi:hypothetical protein
MLIAALDPSFSFVGVSKFDFDIHNHNYYPVDLKLFQNKDLGLKPKNLNDFNRVSHLYSELSSYLMDVDLIIAELPQTGGQNMQARSIWTSGMILSLLSCMVTSLNKPFIPVSPQDIKKIVTGVNSGSKDDVIKWATELYPNLPWLYKTRLGVKSLIDNNEHLADSVGAFHAGIKSKMFFDLIAKYSSMC